LGAQRHMLRRHRRTKRGKFLLGQPTCGEKLWEMRQQSHGVKRDNTQAGRPQHDLVGRWLLLAHAHLRKKV
jgi:hypothetical protein